MARIILSFDDGRKDNITNVFPVLKRLRIPATFNITTGYVDGSLKRENIFCKNISMRVEDVLQISEENIFEIALHGDQHLNTPKDILKARDKLKIWGIDTACIGFASPHHAMGKEKTEVIITLMQELGLNYVRIGGPLKKDKLSMAKREVTRRFPLTRLFVNQFKGCVMKEINENRILYALPVNHRMRTEQLKSLIKYTINKDGTLILLFHSVLKDGENLYENYENVDYEDFVELCEFLKFLQQTEGLILCNTKDLFFENGIGD